MAKLVKKSEATQFTEHDISTFTEYKMPSKKLGLGISEVNGRYPQSGSDADLEIDQIWYVVNGKGKVEVKGEIFDLAEGDMIYIEKGEQFIIDGNLKLIVASAPEWTSSQHKHFD